MRRALGWIGLALIWSGAAAGSATAVHGTGGPLQTITAEQVKRLLEAGDRPIFVDLRPADEFKKSHLPEARSIPLPELRKRYAEVPRTGRVILYCACSPLEIQAAFQFLRDEGYRNVVVLEGGYPGWLKLGYPMER